MAFHHTLTALHASLQLQIILKASVNISICAPSMWRLTAPAQEWSNILNTFVLNRCSWTDHKTFKHTFWKFIIGTRVGRCSLQFEGFSLTVCNVRIARDHSVELVSGI